MQTVEMTIHEGLSKLKVLDKRIRTMTNNKNFCTTSKKNAQTVNGVSIDTVKTDIKSQYDSLNALISNRESIKNAIVISNANTKVKIGDKEYTVAEAIEFKNITMTFLRNLLISLKSDYTACKTLVSDKNAEIERNIQKYVDNKSKTEDSKESLEEAIRAYRIAEESNQLEIVDPLNINDIITELEDKLYTFESEVDSTLSTSNALTKIIVEV